MTEHRPCPSPGLGRMKNKHFRRSKRRNTLGLRVRPGGIPRYWRAVDDGQTRFVSPERAEEWMAVLASRGIPFRLGGRRRRWMYVPIFLEVVAREELRAVAGERLRQVPPLPPAPVHRNAHWVLFVLLLLALWHGIRMNWGPLGGLFTALTPEDWLTRGALDVYRVTFLHEWWRCVTALTLHSDSQHVFGNMLFGAPFLILVCRRIGFGLGLTLIVVAGTLGNAFNALYRPADHVSLGFSTALFGAVGVLSGFMALQGWLSEGEKQIWQTLSWRRGIILLAAGVGVLAMLGTEGERTDYAAHLFGLIAGFGTGGVAGWWVRRFGEPTLKTQSMAGGLLVVSLLLAWWRALG